MGALAALGAAMTWAVASMLFERHGREVGGLALNLIKCVLAAGLMLPTLMLLEGRAWPTSMSAQTLGWLGLSGLVGLSVGDTFWFGCLLRLGARRALLLFTLAPPLTAILARILLDEPFTGMMIVGMCTTLAGVGWVIQEQTVGPAGELAPRIDRVGVAFGCVAALCQAIGAVLTKYAGTDESALSVSLVRLVAGSVGLIIVVAASGRLKRAVLPFREKRTAIGLIAATFLGTYLGIWLMNAGFLNTYVGVASTLNATSPIFALPLAFLVGEKLTRRSVVGAFIAVAGVSLLFFSSGA
ncbi:MAG: drug/metabolite transporter (DMT)-like permease [Bradymonadia bacterium]|jgi:drug/metabolite transporter (DMT)-like permease